VTETEKKMSLQLRDHLSDYILIKHQKCLTDIQFKFMWLYFMCGWKQAEISEHYGFSHARSSQIIGEGKRKLKHHIKRMKWQRI
jgi:DNA-directed RNA polymerase specialized sigma subunit